jgi:hypothetical protein
MTALSGVLLAACLSAPAFAGTTSSKPATSDKTASANMTCEEFVMLDDVVQPKVVYWAEGLDQAGDPVDAVIDLDASDSLVPTIVESCRETPKMSFWEKLKHHS